ncbi:phosphorylase b kinase gamma catalytic chain, skeletal muscle/heart isoform isoform X3 [Hylaeus anthracinus]|uniref:phosphorylase b kinase gamma catalytic chain, skeletal muscle/heart isoform isoform X3 n=1 Tax=Hylaeus volcanicus TaxID=313075 RepID=UPI0023B78927|nr:phosphorylase b kinase gamma catalytic chain, skeletal muscle/heart isoform isoform X3 [Hylaeus volcanicus]XP_054004430.1 phosphorylase b kinase gamma catalytic chain, skeletal muscle/heart isoform isoform X3 [Hylaeus anthracinus]
MMAKDEGDDLLPDKDAAKGFYAKYEPKEILGRGISSTVRRCIEKETGIEYAAKIIDISNETNDDGHTMKDATLQEVHILRRVAGHPYIIELHDVFESSTFIFLIFEICKNGELFDYLTSVVTLSEKKTRYIMRQVFEGVQHIHNQQIVHRDLKPENILLDDNLNVKITDFGFARVLKGEDKLYDLCGTPGYLAPEVLKCNMFENAEGYRYEVDIWACGVIMFTLLVGCPPFWHRKQMVMLRNIMEGKYSFTSPEWADITEAPKDLIRKLLVIEPKKRISIKDALNHSFFHTVELKAKSFNARKRFQLAIICVRAVVRIKRLHTTPEPLSTQVACTDPYRIKILRKVIDGCAFRVYGHWVKKGEGQNRAALFENTPKTELKHLYVSNLSR